MTPGTGSPASLRRSPLHVVVAKAPVLAVLALLLSACVAAGPRNQAEYSGYVYRLVLEDVRETECQYGPYRTRYPDAPQRRTDEFVGGGISLWDGIVFNNLTCTWTSLDGTPRTESIDMRTILANKVVKWNITDVEVHRTQPLAADPHLRVELRDKTLRITIQAMVQYYGEYVANGGRRTPYRIVTNTLLERSGD